MTIERRAIAVEFRTLDDGRRLEGFAARYNVQAKLPSFTETIRPGAFSESLRSGRDILALFDHDPTRLLARTKSGTLRLTDGPEGLAFSLDVPSTGAGRDALALAARGDLGGMSFAFVTPKGGDHWNGNTRELRNVELREISVVSAWPAYPETSVTARAAGAGRLCLGLAAKYLESLP